MNHQILSFLCVEIYFNGSIVVRTIKINFNIYEPSWKVSQAHAWYQMSTGSHIFLAFQNFWMCLTLRSFFSTFRGKFPWWFTFMRIEMLEIPATLIVGFTMDGCILPVFHFLAEDFKIGRFYLPLFVFLLCLQCDWEKGGWHHHFRLFTFAAGCLHSTCSHLLNFKTQQLFIFSKYSCNDHVSCCPFGNIFQLSCWNYH